VTEFRFQLLGPVRAWRDETRLDVGSPQQQAVLAVLLLSRGGHVSLEAMIDALWGQRPPKASTGAVRTYVSRIRQALAKGYPGAGLEIDSTGDGYALHGARLNVDIESFEAQVAEAGTAARNGDGERAAALCRQALALWRGTPLAGVPGPYAGPVRARMAEIRADAVEIASGALIASGEHLGAISELRALANELPLRENLHELLMLALYRAGRQAEALDVYGNVRRILNEDLGLDPGPSLQSMHRRILAADQSLSARPTTPAEPSPAAAAPAPAPAPASLRDSTLRPAPPRTSRLPAPLADFVDHHGDLGRVAGALSGGTHRIAAISGMPGIGKTAFAVRAGHLLAEHFPDGQILLELADTAGTPMTAGEILYTLVHALGPGEFDLSGYAPGTLAWRELLAGRRVLVVLDGVDSVEQVRPILAAPAGCGFILTSRRTLIGLDDTLQHQVTGLDQTESLALLERLIGAPRLDAQPEAAAALVAHCAGRPAALRLVGTRLVSRPDWDLASALWHLIETTPTHPPIDGEPVDAALLSAYRSLTAEQAYVFHSAACFDDAWIQVGQAAALFGMAESTVRDVFESLTDIHLLRPGKWDSYGFDPTVRTLARQLSTL
jgi:DNA-binding SARP family transcriptional activator